LIEQFLRKLSSNEFKKILRKSPTSTLRNCHTEPDEPKCLKLWELVPTCTSFQMRHIQRILVNLFQKGVHCTFFSILDQCALIEDNLWKKKTNFIFQRQIQKDSPLKNQADGQSN